MKNRQPIRLSKRYNKDGSISLISAFRKNVVFKHSDPDAITAFVKGWYGENPIRLNAPVFALNFSQEK